MVCIGIVLCCLHACVVSMCVCVCVWEVVRDDERACVGAHVCVCACVFVCLCVCVSGSWLYVWVCSFICVNACSCVHVGLLFCAREFRSFNRCAQKPFCVVAVLLLFGDWQLTVLSEFFLMVFERIPELFSQ